MATRVSVETIDGQLLVSKVILDGDRRDRRAEAVWLAEAHHGGVVRLHRLVEEPLTIITEHAGGETLRTRACAPPAAAAALAQTCSTLATLHQRGLVHGNITLDHIILGGPDTSAQATLCSPTGTADDPTTDLMALGTCVHQLLKRWDEADVEVAHRPVWDELAERLAQTHGPYGVQRAISVLADLSRETPVPALVPDDHTPRRQRVLGVGVAATFVCLCLAGLLALRSEPEPVGDPVELTIGTSIFTTTAGTPLVVERPCADMPAAALLDPSTGAVWGFYDPADGTTGRPLATVAGATGIEARPAETPSESGEPCTEIWVTGPAGETSLAS